MLGFSLNFISSCTYSVIFRPFLFIFPRQHHVQLLGYWSDHVSMLNQPMCGFTEFLSKTAETFLIRGNKFLNISWGAPTSCNLPNKSSFTSLAAFSPSSRRFLSIIFDLSAAALSSALTVQPMAPNAGAHRPLAQKKKKASVLMVSVPADANNDDGAAPASSTAVWRGWFQSFYPRVNVPSLLFNSEMKQVHPNHLVCYRLLPLVHVETLRAFCPASIHRLPVLAAPPQPRSSCRPGEQLHSSPAPN